MAANGKRASNIYQGSLSTRPYSSSGNDGPRPGAAFREHNIHMENIGKLMEIENQKNPWPAWPVPISMLTPIFWLAWPVEAGSFIQRRFEHLKVKVDVSSVCLLFSF
jgi:hypothetical protein